MSRQVRQSSSRGVRRSSASVTVKPESIDKIVEILEDIGRYPSPVRAVGSDSGSTRCAQTTGTLIDMTGMNRIIRLNEDTVTVGAGMQLRALADRLAGQGLELIGGYEYPERTVGGLISSGSLSAGLPEDASHLAASVTSMQVATPQGRKVVIDESMPEMKRLVLQGYGLFGIICTVTLKIRPIRPYAIRNREFGFEELMQFIPDISGVKAGVKVFLLPFRDRAFVELRFAETGDVTGAKLPWKIRDWACNKAMPDFVHSVGRFLSIHRLRDPLIDGFSETTQRLVNKRFSVVGSNAMEQTGQFRKVRQSTSISHSCWLFPLDSFGDVIDMFRRFSIRYYRRENFRCDLPAIVYRLGHDDSALLSPTGDQPMFALKLRSTNDDGWDHFLMEFADRARRQGGTPLFNQTRGMEPQHGQQAYGKRLAKFRRLRRELDPRNRCLNQFFAEYIG